ncbi:MAG TPA: 16S rRNA (cytidine(1402)-2'-O)-methyltransferase [Candidatus Acidoferrales bacterium]|nr:16S rRNA (cytidine(1402)-2'-O)-methyltransferase [Candidatus Acidoferrales bacterium]
MGAERVSGRGRLYLVATPIGNLDDITLRALAALREADLIACEDTRQTRKLLDRHGIDRPLASYHEHNERERGRELVARLERGETVALVSDAGTPAVSDPGLHLVKLCIERGIPVTPLPGPAALVAALAGAGLETNEFLFVGFVPARAGERRRKLQALAAEPRTLIFYEAPHRLAAMLGDALEILGDRRAVVARELTKIHEEFRRARLSELAAHYRQTPPRGEITLLVAAPEPRADEAAGAPAAGSAPGQSLGERVAQLEAEGHDRKAALKQAARERGISRREAYRRLLIEPKG